jgi:hypothetical protein
MGYELMPSSWKTVAILAILLCAGCGDSKSPGNAAATQGEPPASNSAGDESSHAPSPSPAIASVTIHVKEMGTKLNLL